MEQVVSKYLTHLNIPVSRKYCEKLILSHPDYPSLLSIADTLERLGIRYQVARVEEEHLDRLPFPYLLQPDKEGGYLRFIKRPKDLAGYQAQVSEASGAIVLQAGPADTIDDPENDRRRWEEAFFRIVLVIFGSALAGLLFLLPPYFQNVSWIYASLLVTAAGGVTVGYLLIAKELGVTYRPVEAFCGSGKKANCDAVLRSEAATLFGSVTFSDAAASYFLFQMLMLGLLIPLADGTVSYYGVLGLLGMLTIPVITYSLYYQALKVKTWCRLCLLVDAILIAQAGLFGYLQASGMISIADAGLLPVALTGLLLAATGSGLVLVKNALKRTTKAERAEVTANRLKYAPDVFMYLLRQQRRVDVTPFRQELLIGDPKAPLTITMAASLNCGPCKAGFEQAAQLVATYPGKVSLAVRLRTGSGNNGDPAPGTWLLGYWQQHIHGQPKASARTEQLLRDWYELMDPEQFRKQYPLKPEGVTSEAIETLKGQHAGWMDRTDVKATPTFFINGYLLPKQYRMEDLMGLVPSLVDHVEQQEIRQKTLVTAEEIIPTSGRDKKG